MHARACSSMCMNTAITCHHILFLPIPSKRKRKTHKPDIFFFAQLSCHAKKPTQRRGHCGKVNFVYHHCYLTAGKSGCCHEKKKKKKKNNISREDSLLENDFTDPGNCFEHTRKFHLRNITSAILGFHTLQKFMNTVQSLVEFIHYYVRN